MPSLPHTSPAATLPVRPAGDTTATMPRSAESMRPLYQQLKAQGIDRPYVQAAVLPDWWDDSLYAEPSNRQLAQLYLARFLGVPVSRLASAGTPVLPAGRPVRLKRGSNAADSHVAGAVAAALHAARLVADLLRDDLPFTGVRPALEVRAQLLARPDCTWPDLRTLVDYCWQHGIGVVHVTRLPKVAGSRTIAGLATYVGERPVIVLCSGRDSPAWLAFHLAHELGHVMAGHVRPGGEAVVDLKLEQASDESDERQADEYGFQVLTGHPALELDGPSMNGEMLAAAARQFGEAHRIHPGTVALIYGYSRGRIPVAQRALAIMGHDQGARAILAEAFRNHVPIDELPEPARRTLGATTQIFGLTPPLDVD